MQIQELTIKRREGTGRQVAKRLRRAGAVPAVLYGGAKSEPVTVDPRAVLRIIHGHQGSTQLLTLKVEGESALRMAIIRAMQFDPVSENLLHVDLQEVTANRAITVRVAVHPVGEAGGGKEQQGILNIVMHEVEISCLPTQIPERIDADVTAPMIGDVLTVADLKGSEGGHPPPPRHKVGQRGLDLLAQMLGKSGGREGQAMGARGQWRGEAVALVKPLVFMNVSGPVVGQTPRRQGAAPADLILVYDD